MRFFSLKQQHETPFALKFQFYLLFTCLLHRPYSYYTKVLKKTFLQAPQTTKVNPMGQPSPAFVKAPAAPMTGMPHFQTHSFEPRTREKKIIQIKDPNSSKDVTQEILNRQPSWSLTCNTSGSPGSASTDISEQSSRSSTPPLTRQQREETNVRAWLAQFASALSSANEEKPGKPVDYSIIQKAPVSN